MSKLLGDLIFDIRNTSSSEESRRVIAEELSEIRGEVKNPQPHLLPRIVAKLMYLALLGEKTDFGQMSAISLMTNERFSYKQIGYLGAQLLIDQTSDLSVLLSHTVLKDLQSKNGYIRILALTLIANTEIIEMCKNCATAVVKLFDDSNPRVVKAAVSAAAKIVSLVPDLHSIFTPRIISILSSSSHSIILSAIVFCIEIFGETSNDEKFWSQVNNICQRMLLKLFQSHNPREYAWGIYDDPFLQCRLLRLIGIIGKPSDALDDLLLQIITNLDLKKGVARMILFEAIETTQRVSNKASLRTMALNQVGKLFHLPYPDIVYSSLCAFSRVLYKDGLIADRTSSESQVLARYKSDVVKCLAHKDPSIRRRAIDVLSALIDKENIVSLVPQIASYLPLINSDFRSVIIFKIFTSIQRFAPSKQWNFDAVLDLIVGSGNYVANEIIVGFSNLIGKTPTLQGYAIMKLREAMIEHPTNQSLVQISAWVIGEFCESPDKLMMEELMRIQKLPDTIIETASYIITAISKLAVRSGMIDYGKAYFKDLMKSNSLELQQHAGEAYNILCNDELREFLLAPIEFDEESAGITPYCSEALITPQDSYSSVSQSSQNKIGSPLEPQHIFDLILKPTFTPPAGGKEVLKAQDFVLYFEITKNATNVKQLAIRSSAFNTTSTFNVLKNFKLQFGVQSGWVIACKEPSSHDLMFDGTPIQQVLMLENRGASPLSMKVVASYEIDGRPMTHTDRISPELLVV